MGSGQGAKLWLVLSINLYIETNFAPQVLPATLSHPTVSLLALVIRDPTVFYEVDNTRRVPRLDELRLFTAGSDSGDVVERCLVTGRILVSFYPRIFFFASRRLTLLL